MSPNEEYISVLQKSGPSASVARLAVRVDPARTEQIMATLQARFDLPRNGVVDQAAVKAFSASARLSWPARARSRRRAGHSSGR